MLQSFSSKQNLPCWWYFCILHNFKGISKNKMADVRKKRLKRRQPFWKHIYYLWSKFALCYFTGSKKLGPSVSLTAKQFGISFTKKSEDNCLILDVDIVDMWIIVDVCVYSLKALIFNGKKCEKFHMGGSLDL